MESRLDWTTRGRVDRYKIGIQHSCSTTRDRSHSLFRHSLVFESRSKRRDRFIKNVGPSPATVLKLESGCLFMGVEVVEVEQRHLYRAVSRENRKCPFMDCNDVGLSVSVL
jgi:hypothetical protein